MSQSRKRSPSGLLSEAGKQTMRGVKKAGKKMMGKKAGRGKSATAEFSEAAKKAGRAVAGAARKAVGMRPTKIRKSGSK